MLNLIGKTSGVVGLVLLAMSSLHGSAEASPFVNVTVYGNTDGSSNFTSSTVAAHAGQTIYYEVVAVVAAAGTPNATKNYTLGTQTTGAQGDGVNSLYLNLNTNSSTLSLPTFGPGFADGTGSTNGTQTSSTSVTVIYASQANGVHVGVGTPVVVLTGTVIAGSGNDALTPMFDADGNGQGAGLFVTTAGSKNINFTATSETGKDPYIGYTPLTIATPEPATMGIVGVAILGMLARRRHS